MTSFVKSLGGPIVVMELDLWNVWGGATSNAASKHKSSDYDFACLSREYISVIDISDNLLVVLNDMPMDTTIVSGIRGDAAYIVRIMYGEVQDICNLINDNYYTIFNKKNIIPDNEKLSLTIRGKTVIIADATETKELQLGSDYHLFFDLNAGTYCISNFDISLSEARVIIHKICFASNNAD